MTASDFTEKMYEKIIEAAKRSLIMVGVTAEVSVLPSLKRGVDIELSTSEFNTTPVIYKSIRIGGNATLEKVEGLEGVYDLIFYLNYRFEIFSGGSNGTPLGILYFRVFEERKDVGFVGFLIH